MPNQTWFFEYLSQFLIISCRTSIHHHVTLEFLYTDESKISYNHHNQSV